MPKKLPPIPPLKALNFRKALSIPGLLKTVRKKFSGIEEHRETKPTYSLPDVLMSGLAIFQLKYTSLLAFDDVRDEPRIRNNLHQLYGVEKAPCDTQLRTVLDPVEPDALRPAIVSVIQDVQRHGDLESFRYLGGFLISMDGTGEFSSNHISCPDCMEKKHRSGETEYYHQLLAAAIVHPDKKTVLPLFSEAIEKQDGNSKNDCERNAGKRLLPALGKAFPRLKIIILEDALAGNGPHIDTLTEQGFSYIIRAKTGSNESLMDEAQKRIIAGEADEFERFDEAAEVTRGYRFVNDLPLNKEHPEIRVNYLDYRETDKEGNEKNFVWLTDITLSRDNAYHVMRAGRARWKVENETFNTLKNLGYNFEHNYGHGKENLATVLANLMMLAFLLDQVQENSCNLFQAARHRFHARTSLWEKIRGIFTEHYIDDWKTFYMAIIFGHIGDKLVPNYPDTS